MLSTVGSGCCFVPPVHVSTEVRIGESVIVAKNSAQANLENAAEWLIALISLWLATSAAHTTLMLCFTLGPLLIKVKRWFSL